MNCATGLVSARRSSSGRLWRALAISVPAPEAVRIGAWLYDGHGDADPAGVSEPVHDAQGVERHAQADADADGGPQANLVPDPLHAGRLTNLASQCAGP